MLSAGLLGGPGIGFKQDKFASEKLQELSPDTFARYKAANENQFLVFKTNGLDGAKVSTLGDEGKSLSNEIAILQKAGGKDESLEKLNSWWESDAKVHATEDKKPVTDATLFGSRTALKLTSVVPATMAVLFLLLIGYFKSIGGYKPVELDAQEGKH
jgi:hypothetical protein